MSKKLMVIIAVVLVIVFGGITGYFVLSSRSGTSKSPSLPFIQDKAQVKGDLTYTDDSGFSFSYPTGVKVSDETPDSESYYTLLVLEKGGQKMTITIKDIEDDEDNIKGATLIGAESLGEISAKQYSLENTVITIANDQGIFYKIEGPKDSGFWEDTQNIVVSSFAFAGSSKATSQSSSGEDAIYEEEEVIE